MKNNECDCEQLALAEIDDAHRMAGKEELDDE